MTINAVQESPSLEGGANVTSLAFAFDSDVTSGNLCVVACCLYQEPARTPAAGDLTKTSGTSTIGTIALDVVQQQSPDTKFSVAIYSFLVTGSGSLTLTWNGGQTGSYPSIGWGEYSTTQSWDASRLEDTSSSTATTSSAADSGNATSAGAAIFIGAETDTRGTYTTTTEDGAFTLVAENEDPSTTNVGSMIRRIVTTGTTDSASWTLGTTTAWAAAVAVYKEAAGGGGSKVPLFMAHYAQQGIS